MNRNGVTKGTRDRNVRRFAKESVSAWKSLNDFVDAHCKRKSAKEREAFMNDLCPIIDRYIEFNCAILTWCHKNGVNPEDFVCDVVNLGCGNL